MSERVSMPALGESVTEGTVTRWLKSVGDEVEVDEPLLEVSTDKVDTEIPSPVAGVLQEILAEEDETVEVGADLAVIGDEAAEPSDSSGDESDAQDEDDSQGNSDSQDDSDSQNDNDNDSDAESGAEESSPEGDTSSSGDQADESSGEGERVTMPALGESVTEGTVTRWLKEEGDDVDVDEPLLEVSTDKVDTEIPSPVAGKLTQILAAEDDTVEVGGDLAIIGGAAGSAAPEEDSDADSSDGEAGSAAPEEDSDADSGGGADSDGGEEDLASEQKLHEEADEQSATTEGSEASGQSSGSKGQAEDSQGEQSDAPTADTSQSADSTGDSKDVSAYVTPLVRKLAAKHDVDLDAIEGTGVGGRIRKQDVLDAAKSAQDEPEPQAPAAASASSTESASSTKNATSAPSAGSAPAGGGAASEKRGTTEKMSRLRKVIATRMVESLQVSAQLTTVVEVDVTKVAQLRTQAKNEFQKREGVKLSFMPFFALAAVEALKQHPTVNSSIDGEQVVFHAQENLGIAVDTEKGLIVPVIKDAGDLNVAGLARKIADLAERTRTNKVGPDELGGGTFTLTNTGSRGALFDTPILNQPQVGILGTGSVVRRPVVRVDEDGGETIAIRSMVYLALTYDHRIVDGADAARFLSTVKARLEEASFEV
ncbi:MAG: 2-oxoglutarate dehydrogenase, E2 component, dihydrolipoamide succinyltransferase [Ornithinimicrobium sp.]